MKVIIYDAAKIKFAEVERVDEIALHKGYLTLFRYKDNYLKEAVSNFNILGLSFEVIK